MINEAPNPGDLLVGTALETARRNAGLSTPELAEMMQIDPFHLSLSENGRRRLRTCELVSASQVLNVPVSTFHGRPAGASPPAPALRLVG